MDWSKCRDVESKPVVVSAAWVVRGTRVHADAVIDNADDGFTPQEMPTEISPTVPVAAVRPIIAFARQPCAG